MAEGEGFEPSKDVTALNGFRDRPIQPLWHPSGAARANGPARERRKLAEAAGRRKRSRRLRGDFDAGKSAPYSAAFGISVAA